MKEQIVSFSEKGWFNCSISIFFLKKTIPEFRDNSIRNLELKRIPKLF